MKNASPIRISTERGPEEQLHQADGDRDAGGAHHPDHEGRTGVQRLARLPEPARPPLRVGVLDGLADRVVLFNLIEER